MRILLFASAAFIAACQGEDPANDQFATSEGVVTNVAAAGGPDQPVSSDDPQPFAPPEPDQPTSDCPILKSNDWRAHVDAMPGPNDNPRLIVSGKITVPTSGYKLALRMGPVAESYPVQVTVYLDAIPPSGPATQALERRQVRGTWRSEERVGSVAIRCGSRMLARIGNVETAH